jgi:N-acetylmuramoyl-L-alanine amidase
LTAILTMMYKTTDSFSRSGYAKRLGLLTSLLLITLLTQAQSVLPRISVAERSDGLGYVIRYHFTTAPDSFKVFQPSANLVQIAIYKSGVDVARVSLPSGGAGILGMNLTEIPGGFGTDVRLPGTRSYLASAYPDANRRHLLVGLTEISRRELNLLTDGQPVIDWLTAHSTPVSSQTPPTDEIAPNNSTLDKSGDTQDTVSTDLQDIDTLPDSLRAPITAFNSNLSQRPQLRTVVLDAGHGGHDPGAIGHVLRTREKDVALSVVKKVGAYLNEHLPEVNVVYTRTDDRFIPLQERGSIANRARGDLFVSIHANSARSRQAYGAEVFFLGIARTESALEVMKKENEVILLEDASTRSRELTDEELILYELNNIGYISASQRLAELVERQFAQRAQRRSRGVKQAQFIVLYHASMPAILVELGFISNANEERYLASDSGQNVLASAIYRAIREYKEIIEH